MTSPAPPLKSCGILLFQDFDDRSFLLMRHASRWDLPKGHTEPGESEVETALRELREETGIAADLVRLDPAFRFETRYAVKSKRLQGAVGEKSLVIFLGLLTIPCDIVVTEHQAFDWFRWRPPHRIQDRTIDPLLGAAERYFSEPTSLPILQR